MISGLLTGFARLVCAHRASQAYLVLVAAVTVWVTIDIQFVHHEDASLAGAWLFLLAAPTIFVFFAVGGLFGEAFANSDAFLDAALILSVLIQAAAVGAFARLLQGRSGPAHPRET